MQDPRTILITGAAGGIGSALAMVYAEPGRTLFLCDSESAKIEKVREICTQLGAETIADAMDVRNREEMARWLADCDAHRSLDLVIANAGISRGNARREETEEDIREVFAVNIDGTLNTILPALSFFRKRGRGQLALMSSLAGFRGFPHAPSYCASKGAIRILGQGLRARLKREGIIVSVIIPAFVKTPMTDANLYRMPRLITAEKAARIIKRKLAAGKSEFVFPRPFPAVAWAMSAMPPSLMARFTAFK